MASFRIRLLGAPALEQDGRAGVIVEAQKALALLGYLVCQGQPVPRRQLAALLWGDTTDYRSRRNLTHALGLLTARLPGCFRSDLRSVQWQPSPEVWVDLSASAALLDLPADGQRRPFDGGTPEPGLWVDRLEQGVALYRGELLAGLTLAGCLDFETWLVRERERWHRLVVDAHAALVSHHAHRGDPAQAEQYARRWLELEPWEEQAHRALMRLLCDRGRQAEALAQFELCRRTLVAELGVSPDGATFALAEEIRWRTRDRSGHREREAELANLVRDYGLRGSAAEAAALSAHYAGIPLALQLIAATIRELFDGSIAAFLRAGIPILGDVRTLLDSQFARLSALEQDVLLWLAVERNAAGSDPGRSPRPPWVAGRPARGHAAAAPALACRGTRRRPGAPERRDGVRDRLSRARCLRRARREAP